MIATWIQYWPLNTEDKLECGDADCPLLLGVFWTMLFSDGPVTDGDWPRTEAGVDSRGMRRQFDAAFEPDGGLDVCELSLKRSNRVSMFTSSHVRQTPKPVTKHLKHSTRTLNNLVTLKKLTTTVITATDRSTCIESDMCCIVKWSFITIMWWFRCT